MRASYAEAVQRIEDNEGICDEIAQFVAWKKAKMVYFN